MKIGQALTFIHEVEGRIYTLIFPIPAPLGECYDVASAVCNKFLEEIKATEEKKAEKISKQSDSKKSKCPNQEKKE